MKAIGHLLERLAAAEEAARRRASLDFTRLTPPQVRMIDTFFKEVRGLGDDERNSKWVAFLDANAEIAIRLYPATAAGR